MTLIDLKRPKKSKAELKKESLPTLAYEEQDRYPHGLTLRFEKEEIDKIPALESVKADAEVQISAVGFVKVVEITDASEKADRWQRSRKTVEIQVTRVAIEPKAKKALAEMDNEEYRQARKG